MGNVDSVRRTAGFLIGAAVFALGLWLTLPGEAGPLERAYCATLAAGFAFLIAAATGRPAFGLFLSGALFGILYLANFYKQQFLHAPLMAPDLRYVTDRETVGVILKYRHVSRRAVAAVVVGICLGVMAWRWSGPPLWQRVASIPRRWFGAVGSAFAVVVALAAACGAHGPFASLYDRKPWDFMQSARANPMSGFFVSFTRMAITLPDYAQDAASHIDWHPPSAPAAAPAIKPDIVAVLEESTFPPRLLKMCDLPVCDAAMFEPDARTAARGPLQVHTFGGATWVSEFAFLTGLPHTLFGPAGIYAPYNLAPRMHESLPRTLKANGYRAIAIYPMQRAFGNAGNAYADYGFDAFYDADDLDLKWESTDLDLERGFESILARERAAFGDRPLFVFLLTMRQHGPHEQPLSELPPPFDHPLFPDASPTLNLNLGNFLARLHDSDRALAAIERRVFDGGRPTVLLHYGDHQPAFGGLELDLPKRTPLEYAPIAYSTTYFMLKREPAPEKRQDYAMLDIAFLPGLLLDAAGVPPGDYFGANQRLRDVCKGRFAECDHPDLLESFYAEVFGRQHVFGG